MRRTLNTRSGLPLLLSCLISCLAGCFEDPYEEIVIGSCHHDGDPVYLEIETCQEFFQERHGRDEQRDVCRKNRGRWSDDPCDKEEACGHCVEPRETSTLTTCFYPTENVPIADDDLRASCEFSMYDGDHWIENPDISCE